jgi:class 3 adenylate cyclase
MSTDLREIVPTIQAPTLILQRVGDRVCPVENARYLAEHIPRARLLEFPGDDHLPSSEAPEALLGEIEEFLTGVRTVPDLDRVLATVLFTDIVGSTERAAALGDQRWRELLEEHHRVVRAELERYRGREVKTTGDGVLATFEGPARAIRCTQSMVNALRKLGIEIRAGIHTGECELMGLDVGGIAVHIAARVAGMAGPGEVLVSSTVKDLVAGSAIEFDDRGRHSLKGVPGEWLLFAAREA